MDLLCGFIILLIVEENWMAKATTDTCKSVRWCLSDRQRHRSFIQFLRWSSGRWMRQSGRERARGGVVLVFPHYLKKNTADRQRKKDTQTLVRLWCCTRIWQKQLRDAALSIIPLVDRRAHIHTDTQTHKPRSWQMHHGGTVLLCFLTNMTVCVCVVVRFAHRPGTQTQNAPFPSNIIFEC